MKPVRYNIHLVPKSKLRRLWDFILRGDTSKVQKKLSPPIQIGDPGWHDADIEAYAYKFGDLGWRVKTKNLKTGETVEARQ